jgi:hypothetical protein
MRCGLLAGSMAASMMTVHRIEGVPFITGLRHPCPSPYAAYRVFGVKEIEFVLATHTRGSTASGDD